MIVVPIFVALVAVPVIAGVWRRDSKRPDWVGLLLAGLVGVVFAVLAITMHDPDVSGDAAVKGVALAGLLGALPSYGLFELGRALARRRVALAAVCLALAVPLGFGYVVGWFVVLDHVRCPPDAYECPL